MKLLTFLSKACAYAQEHINCPDAWNTSEAHRKELLQCTSFQVACFLSQNTLFGNEGVEWEIVIKELSEYPMKTEDQWNEILCEKAGIYGGWVNN